MTPPDRNIPAQQKDECSIALIARLMRMSLIIVTILALIWLAGRLLLLLFASILLATLLHSTASFLARVIGIGRRPALAVVCLLIIVTIGGGGVLIAPAIAEQSSELWRQLPAAWGSVVGWLERFGWGREALEWAPAQLSQMADEASGEAAGRLLGAASTTLGGFADLVVIIVLAIYLAIEPRPYREAAIRLIPPARRERAREIVDQVGETLRWWLLGQLLAMSMIGVATGIGLWMLGIPLALTLGLFAGLITFIPTVGPILAFFPAFVVAVGQGGWSALYVLLLYLGIQAVESYLITPIVQRRTVSLPPALTLSVLVLAGLSLGILGLALATPFAAAAIVMIRMVYVEDVLGDRTFGSKHRIDGTIKNSPEYLRKSSLDM